MEEELNMIVLSALLHDIGKFGQRADRPYSEDMIDVYLTPDREEKGHWHTLYTDYFIKNDLPLPHYLKEHKSILAQTASAHHKPHKSDLSQICLMIADRLSSGAEHISDDTEEIKTGFRQSRLVSIFDEVELVNHSFKSPGNSYHKLTLLNTKTDSLFPLIGKPEGFEEDYKHLFYKFLKDLNNIDTGLNFHFYLDSVITALEKYTWCIPSSSYNTVRDVSLFDHALSTAGIAQALYLYHRDKNTIPRWEDNEEKFILFGGALSGIQNYIFDISRDSGRGVSKIFRARSFYLQAVTKSVLLEIEKRLNIFSVCRLVDSGGKFILLLPVTDKVEPELEEFTEACEKWFFEKFKGMLTMNFSEPLLIKQEDFLMGNFQNTLDRLNESLDQAKFNKLKNIIHKKGPIISHDYETFQDGNCSICRINAAHASAIRDYKKEENFDEDLDIFICSDCCEQITYIGKKLPGTQYLIYKKDSAGIRLFASVTLSLSENLPHTLDDVIHIESLDESVNFSRVRLARYVPQIEKEECDNKQWSALFLQETDQKTIKPGQPKDFSMIAHKSKKPKSKRDDILTGRSLLGFFKADVDNLGLMFSLGLEKYMSASRVSSLSRMLNLFFSEYLVELAKREYPNIYVVFAGGDDLFLAGPWWQIIEFAILLRKKLTHYCAGNPDITLSGGMLAAKPRLPMRKAAQIVEEYLKKAKAHKDDKGEARQKDSVFFLDEVLSWQELEKFIKIGEIFDRAIENKERTGFSTAFIYRLLEYHKMYKKFIDKKNKEIKYGQYLSLAHYDIGRNIRLEKYDNVKECQILEQIFVVGVSERPELERLNIPLFYALNRNRDK